VGDAVAANLLAVRAPLKEGGRKYNVAPGSRTSINELLRSLGETVGGWPQVIHAEPRPGDVRHSLADTSAVADALGFSAQVTLMGGLEMSRDYFIRHANHAKGE
jgi:UDP-glucose 4-epimerase